MVKVWVLVITLLTRLEQQRFTISDMAVRACIFLHAACNQLPQCLHTLKTLESILLLVFISDNVISGWASLKDTQSFWCNVMQLKILSAPPTENHDSLISVVEFTLGVLQRTNFVQATCFVSWITYAGTELGLVLGKGRYSEYLRCMTMLFTKNAPPYTTRKTPINFKTVIS